MSDDAPVVYLFCGDDGDAIDQAVHEVVAHLGDSPNAAMNLTELDGRTASFADLASAAGAMPFLSPRRVVLLTNPVEGFGKASERGKFTGFLEDLPQTTALVLVEYRPLTDPRDRRKGKLHWLEDWAAQHAPKAFVKSFSKPRGGEMTRWIVARAREKGGSFSYDGAGMLTELVDSDTRTADLEIDKLLLYVNFNRPVEADDVLALTAYEGEGDIFGLVDALGNRNGREAIAKLHELLNTQDPLPILGMIVRQFRLLLQAREILDRGGDENAVTKRLNLHPYVGKKITGQARRFRMQTLEATYHRLLEVDLAMKSSDMDGDQLLDVFIAEQMY